MRPVSLVSLRVGGANEAMLRTATDSPTATSGALFNAAHMISLKIYLVIKIVGY